MELDVRYSKHAREQMIERGISEHEVQEAIKQGTKVSQGSGKICFVFRYYQVVCKKVGDTYFVITVMLR